MHLARPATPAKLSQFYSNPKTEASASSPSKVHPEPWNKASRIGCPQLSFLAPFAVKSFAAPCTPTGRASPETGTWTPAHHPSPPTLFSGPSGLFLRDLCQDLCPRRKLNCPPGAKSLARYNQETMDPARIAELLRPFLAGPPANSAVHHSKNPSDEEPAVLSHSQLQSISTYIDILVRWNTRINLTAIRDPEDIVTRHFGESLFAARILFPVPSSVSSVPSVVKGVGVAAADIGSGAGFPGLPLKLWAPHISLTLIESNHKKSAFLKEVTRALTLTDVNIQNARAETLTSRYSVVTLRAVERFESILPTAAALVAPAGRLALLIGSAQESQARTTLHDLRWFPPVPVPKSRTRILLVANRPE